MDAQANRKGEKPFHLVRAVSGERQADACAQPFVHRMAKTSHRPCERSLHAPVGVVLRREPVKAHAHVTHS